MAKKPNKKKMREEFNDLFDKGKADEAFLYLKDNLSKKDFNKNMINEERDLIELINRISSDIKASKKDLKTINALESIAGKEIVNLVTSSDKQGQEMLEVFHMLSHGVANVLKFRGDKASPIMKNFSKAVSKLSDEDYNDVISWSNMIVSFPLENDTIDKQDTPKNPITKNQFKPK